MRNGPLTVSYSNNCPSFGPSGNFITDTRGNQGSLNSDDRSIANDLSTGGSDDNRLPAVSGRGLPPRGQLGGLLLVDHGRDERDDEDTIVGAFAVE